jgi:hypothetical protein
MDDIFVNLTGYELSEIKFLFWLWCKIIGLRCQIVGVFVRHQMKIMLLDVFDNL